MLQNGHWIEHTRPFTEITLKVSAITKIVSNNFTYGDNNVWNRVPYACSTPDIHTSEGSPSFIYSVLINDWKWYAVRALVSLYSFPHTFYITLPNECVYVRIQNGNAIAGQWQLAYTSNISSILSFDFDFEFASNRPDSWMYHLYAFLNLFQCHRRHHHHHQQHFRMHEIRFFYYSETAQKDEHTRLVHARKNTI